MKKFLLLFFIFITFGASSIVAQPSIPDPTGRWVIDDANVLSEATKKTVSSLCQNEFDSTSNQIVVYLFNSLEGSTIESYANEVFNTWEIGSKTDNNGVLLIVAVKDRKMRIEVGYGLEPYLTDLESKTIIDDDIRPRFKEGDFDAGITHGVEKIIEGIRGNLPTRSNSGRDNSPISSTENMIGFLIIGIFFIGFYSLLGLLFSRVKGPAAWRNFGISQLVFAYFSLSVDFKWYKLIFAFISIGLMTLGFWKIRTYWLKKYGNDDKKWIIFNKGTGGGMFFGSKFTSSRGSGSGFGGGGGGGFSGGGGSSGGGGASGSW